MKKIDIFVWQEKTNLTYKCSTNKAKTCREAIDKFKAAFPEFKESYVKAYYVKH